MAYAESEQAEALLKLALNKYDFDLTSEELGISKRTLRRWDKIAPKKRVRWHLERALIHILAHVPDPMPGKDWALAVGILTDKIMLFEGMPTERIENIINKLADTEGNEFDGILEEAERILEGEYSSSEVDHEDSPGET
jgi:hypothetical protein